MVAYHMICSLDHRFALNPDLNLNFIQAIILFRLFLKIKDDKKTKYRFDKKVKT